jgi:hypothetical protein
MPTFREIDGSDFASGGRAIRKENADSFGPSAFVEGA